MIHSPEQFPSPEYQPAEQAPEQEPRGYDFSNAWEMQILLKELGISSLQELTPEQSQRLQQRGEELFLREAMPVGNPEQATQELEVLFDQRVDVARMAKQSPQILYMYSHCKALEQQGKLTKEQTKNYFLKRFGWQEDAPVDMRHIDDMLAESAKSYREQLLGSFTREIPQT